MNIAGFIHSVVTGPSRRRRGLTLAGFAFFSCVILAVVFGARWLDARLGLRLPIPLPVALTAGVIALGLGVSLVAWCVIVFRSARGTPVPFNPPRELVVRGPYLRMRNPMLSGLFCALAGAGLILRSPALLFGFLPVVILGTCAEAKLVEEPELELRFGAQYLEYRRRVPMFVPRLAGGAGRGGRC